MDQSHPDRIVLTEPEELLCAVPVLLGFHPRDSLVAIVLAQGRVQLTARSDLDAVSCRERAARVFAAAWRRFPASQVTLVAYSDDDLPAWVALEGAASGAPACLGLFQVSHEGWRSRPWEPFAPLRVDESRIMAQAIGCGRRVARSRDEVERSLSAVVSGAAMRAARRGARERPLTAIADEARAVWLEAGRHDVDAETAAVLARALEHQPFREEVVMSMRRETAMSQVTLWLDVVRRVPATDGWRAAIVLGIAAWLAGEGVLVCACLDLASGSEHDPWYRFLETVVATCLPPGQWEAVRSALMDGPRVA